MDNSPTLLATDSSSHPKDMATDSMGSGSNIATLLPFSTAVEKSARGAQSPKGSQTQRRNKKAVKSHDNKSIQIAPGIYEPNDYDKYLTVVLDDENADIFNIHRDLVSCCGKEPTIYSQGSSRILVEASSPEVSRKLQDLTLLGGVTATCTPHNTMKKSKGIILCPTTVMVPRGQTL